MRTLLPLAALLTAFHPTSDACGWVPPRVEVHKVTFHSLQDGNRAFAVLGAAPAVDDTDWQPLSPLTYDNTRIAELAPAKHQLTLVGDKGARVITAAHQVALRGGWQLGDGTPHSALEIPVGYTIALEGSIPDAKWHPILYTYSTTQKIRDLGYEVKLVKDGYQILWQGHVATNVQGSVLGMLDTGRERFIVVEQTRGAPQAIYFGAILPST
jgi:hypothetical protein